MDKEESQPLHIRLALAVYLSLPFSLNMRRRVRDFLFSRLGGLFSHHPAYHQWRGHADPFLREKREFIKKYGKARDPKAPDEHDWYRLALARDGRMNAQPVVDVIIPVYKGYDDTLRAIYQALTAGNTTPHEVIVINDCSPDKGLVRILRRLSGMGLFTLLENTENLGFVRTVNRGMRLHETRDCILLNADCMVYGDYIDRMMQIAAEHSDVATITPLTNNGELCSYPLQWHDNAWRNELSDRKLDRLCWRVNGISSVKAPTGVGYCMFVSRQSLAAVGYFDADRFGRGYGEENDFCMRAKAAGFSNLLAGGIFVRHVGGSSFGAEKSKRIRNAMKTMKELHPSYSSEVEEWRRQAPAKRMRIAIDRARLAMECRPSMLMVLHTWGGGTEKYVRDMAGWIEEEGLQVLYLMPVEGDCESCQLGLFRQGKFQAIYTPNLRYRIREELDLLAEILADLQVRHIHVSHLIGYDEVYYSGITMLADRLKVAYDVTLHDYFSICPRTNLIDASSVYCGEPDLDACNRCIQKHGSPVTRYKLNEPEVGAWRQMHSEFLLAARQVYVPNHDVSERLKRYFPAINFIVRPHPEHSIHRPESEAMPSVNLRKIAMIGALHELKGALVLKELARDAYERKLPLEFHIFGFYAVNNTEIYTYGNVKETGKFKEEELPALIASANPEIALFLSVWPETFSYTLSQAYQLGLYPVSFDMGAPAARIRACGWGHLLPVEYVHKVSAINDILVALEIPPKPAQLAVWEKDSCYPDLITDYYGLQRVALGMDESRKKAG